MKSCSNLSEVKRSRYVILSDHLPQDRECRIRGESVAEQVLERQSEQCIHSRLPRASTLTSESAEKDSRILTQSHLIHGDSEMAVLIRAHDWSASPVGPIESWPSSLRSAVNLMLGCGFPTSIWWRGDGVQFYNDGYRPLMAEKHPAGLGQLARECWREAWDLVSPQVQSVVEHGRPVSMKTD